MEMNFHPWRGGSYDFSSLYKKVMKLFILPHEGYGVNCKPPNIRFHLVTSSRTLVIENNFSTFVLENNFCTLEIT
jgi:hypothetical protein